MEAQAEASMAGGRAVEGPGAGGPMRIVDPMLGDMLGMFDQQESMLSNMMRAI